MSMLLVRAAVEFPKYEVIPRSRGTSLYRRCFLNTKLVIPRTTLCTPAPPLLPLCQQGRRSLEPGALQNLGAFVSCQLRAGSESLIWLSMGAIALSVRSDLAPDSIRSSEYQCITAIYMTVQLASVDQAKDRAELFGQSMRSLSHVYIQNCRKAYAVRLLTGMTNRTTAAL